MSGDQDEFDNAADREKWSPPHGFVYSGDLRIPMTFRIPGNVASEQFREEYERVHAMPADDEDWPTDRQLDWGRQADAEYNRYVASYLAQETGHQDWQAPTVFVEEGHAAGPGWPADLIYLLQQADQWPTPSATGSSLRPLFGRPSPPSKRSGTVIPN